MVRHDQVAAGQLTTQQFLAQYGAARWARDLVVTTFQSFWGQFGWMGVPLPERVYAALGILSALVGAGLAVYLWHLRSRTIEFDGEGVGQDASATSSRPLAAGDDARTRSGWRSYLGTRAYGTFRVAPNWRGMALLAAWALGTTLVFLWYNTKYVQHQGRYLFPALVPWGLAFTLGLRTVLRRSLRPVLAALGAVFLALVAYGVLRGDFKEFYVGLTISAAAAIAIGHWLESRRPGAAIALAYLGLCGLALVCLYLYVVPNLQPPL